MRPNDAATQKVAQRRVDTIDRALAALRAEVALLAPVGRAARMQDVQALIAAQARARNHVYRVKPADKRKRTDHPSLQPDAAEV